MSLFYLLALLSTKSQNIDCREVDSVLKKIICETAWIKIRVMDVANYLCMTLMFKKKNTVIENVLFILSWCFNCVASLLIIQWMRARWTSDPCYAFYGVDGSDCSFLIYLSEVEWFCPPLAWRNHSSPPTQHTHQPKAPKRQVRGVTISIYVHFPLDTNYWPRSSGLLLQCKWGSAKVVFREEGWKHFPLRPCSLFAVIPRLPSAQTSLYFWTKLEREKSRLVSWNAESVAWRRSGPQPLTAWILSWRNGGGTRKR